MENPEKIEIEGLKTIHKLCKFGADHNMEGCTFTEIVERMFSKIEQMKTQVNTLDEMLLNQGEALAQAKAQAVPEGFGDIQSWIAVNSFSALDASIVDFPVVDANELAEFIDSLNIDVAVPEGFVLLPIKDAKFFSHDGDNYEVHDTLVEAKYEAECAIEHYRERLADQLSDPRSDGNFQDVGYGVVLAKSGYSIDHVVTQADIDKGDYSYEVGTEILSLFLIEAQEPAND